MFGFFDRDKLHPIDQPIKRVLDEMEMDGPESEEYPNHVKHLGELYKIKREDRKPLFNPDTLLIAGANILVTLIIVGYEQKHVITSKAQQFSLKSNPQVNQL